MVRQRPWACSGLDSTTLNRQSRHLKKLNAVASNRLVLPLGITSTPSQTPPGIGPIAAPQNIEQPGYWQRRRLGERCRDRDNHHCERLVATTTDLTYPIFPGRALRPSELDLKLT